MMNLNFYMISMLFLDFLMLLIMCLPSNLFKFSPLFLSILLVIYTLLMSLKLNYLMNTFWYSYILFLVMIGGLMILFLYFTGLSNNQMIDFNLIHFFYLCVKIFFLFEIFKNFLNYYMAFFPYKNFNDLNLFMMLTYKVENELMKNLMMDYSMSMNLYLIMYLFFMMVCSCLICKKNMLPLRQMFNYE